jgi:Zn-dependent M16 (insulinase) family peptidase
LNPNFSLQSAIELNAINSIGYVYYHTSGANLVFIKNNDKNKVFSITFKTPPENDKGCPHVLEHCTLCGSKNFPLKDTFSELVSSSLYTYLNAITFKDRTIYPVASIYDDEFKKLIDIYLDSVFNPLLRLETFLHEAWHYEQDKDNNTGIFNGVVYSEMKSSFSNPFRRARSFIHKKLFSNTSYQFEASGIPNDILKLTHEELILFYKKYYLPTNSFIYLYGDINDLNYYLDRFDFYLSQDNDYSKEKIILYKERDLNSQIIASTLYNFAGAKKNFYAAGYMISDALDLETRLAFNVINSYLSKTVGAPLKKFLPSVKTIYETDLLQPIYFVLSENFNGSTDKFMTTLKRIFAKIYSTGLNKLLLDSCINDLEFRLRSETHKYKPKGLVINLLILPNWIYGGNIFLALDRINILNSLREKVSQNYFDELVKKYLVFNNNSAFISLIPDSKKDLDIEVTQQDIDNFFVMQKFIKSKEINSRKIKLADINQEPVEFDEIVLYGNILYLNLDTEGIIYLNFIFKTDSVEKNLLFELGLLCDVLVFVALENNTQVDPKTNAQIILNNLGHIKIDFEIEDANDGYVPNLVLKIKLMPKNIRNIISVLNEIFTLKKFDAKDLIKKILIQKLNDMSNSFLIKSHEIVRDKIFSYCNDGFKYKDFVCGINFYFNLKDFVANFDDRYKDAIKNLKIVFNEVCTQENLTVLIACDSNNFNLIYPEINNIREKIKSEPKIKFDYVFDNYLTNEGFFTTANINSNAMAILFEKKIIDSGKKYVLENFITKNYLTREIRINNGAYDTGCEFKNNFIYFYSSADPNINLTFEKFDLILDYIINYNFAKRDIKKAIISAINNFDRIKPIDNRISDAYSKYINGITQEKNYETRKEICDTKIDDLKNLAQEIKNNTKQIMLTTIGEREEVLNNKSLYTKIYRLIK